MKTYKILAGDKSYTLAGITGEVKEDITDIVQADERNRLYRQFKKGLLTAEVYTVEQDGLKGLAFASKGVVSYLSTPEGKKRLFRCLLEHGGKCDEPTEADIEAIYAAASDDANPAKLVMDQIYADAFPKATTPPVLTVQADATP